MFKIKTINQFKNSTTLNEFVGISFQVWLKQTFLKFAICFESKRRCDFERRRLRAVSTFENFLTWMTLEGPSEKRPLTYKKIFQQMLVEVDEFIVKNIDWSYKFYIKAT